MSKKTHINLSRKNIVVFYHAYCPDGFGGAYAAWKRFGSRAEYIPLEYGKPMPIFPRQSQVYFIDIIAPESELLSLIRANRRVTAIDHHISSRYLVKKTYKYLYALNHSGATLAWRYFHKRKKMPQLLLSIEDGDLWRMKLPYTQAINAVLEMQEFDFKIWDKLVKAFENSKDRKNIIKDGKLLLNYKGKIIEGIIEQGARLVKFKGIRTYAVNSPIYKDEIGNRLATKYPPMAIVWTERKNKRKISLRSVPNFNVSRLAQKMDGGGGHKNAASFTMDINKPLPWKRL
ncbi:MAG TPA: DHHA1 domain-containing protein [Candidatus Paceibacterota bacterium]